jgi:cell division protein FtsL
VLLVAGFAIVVIGLLQVVQTSEATTTSFSIQRLEQERLELRAAVSDLEAEVAGLSSLARIEREAKRLGLEPPVAREAVQVNVPWPGGEAFVPMRFAPAGDAAEVDGHPEESGWWEKLLKPLPFY